MKTNISISCHSNSGKIYNGKITSIRKKIFNEIGSPNSCFLKDISAVIDGNRQVCDARFKSYDKKVNLRFPIGTVEIETSQLINA